MLGKLQQDQVHVTSNNMPVFLCVVTKTKLLWALELGEGDLLDIWIFCSCCWCCNSVQFIVFMYISSYLRASCWYFSVLFVLGYGNGDTYCVKSCAFDIIFHLLFEMEIPVSNIVQISLIWYMFLFLELFPSTIFECMVNRSLNHRPFSLICRTIQRIILLFWELSMWIIFAYVINELLAQLALRPPSKVEVIPSNHMNCKSPCAEMSGKLILPPRPPKHQVLLVPLK